MFITTVLDVDGGSTLFITVFITITTVDPPILECYLAVESKICWEHEARGSRSLDCDEQQRLSE